MVTRAASASLVDANATFDPIAWTRSILTSVPLLAAVVYFIVLALRPSSFNGLLLIDLWVLAVQTTL